MEKENIKLGTIVHLSNPELISGNGIYFVSNENIEMIKSQCSFVKQCQNVEKSAMLIEHLLNKFHEEHDVNNEFFPTPKASDYIEV
jgi:hypothetical protein